MSVVYSPDGQRIISGSYDKTIRIWNAETGSAIGNPVEGHNRSVTSIAYTPDAQHNNFGSSDRDIHLWDSSTQDPPRIVSSIEAKRPDHDGWVTDSRDGLLYWVPHDCRRGLHSPALLTIPLTYPIRSVSLQFDKFAFGTSWTQIFITARS